MIATAGGEHKVQVCRDLGADHVIDYTADDFVPIVKEITGGHGADVIYDPVGGDVFDKSRKVIATAGGERKTEVCRSLGADHVIDYTAEDFVPLVKEITGGHGADVVYDPVGGEVFDKSRRCIAFEGRLVVVGFTSGRIPSAPANHVLVKNYSVVGLHWGLYRKMEPSIVGTVHAELTRLVEGGQIDPLIGEVLPLDQAPQALARLADRSTVGKVVLVP